MIQLVDGDGEAHPVCTECGDDDPTPGHELCTDCLQAGLVPDP